MKVCSQLLCPDLAEDDLRDRDSRDGGVLDVLDSLETCFPIKYVDGDGEVTKYRQ